MKLTPGQKAFIREYIYAHRVIWPARIRPVADRLEAMGLVNCQHPLEGNDQFLATLTTEGKKAYEVLDRGPQPGRFRPRV